MSVYRQHYIDRIKAIKEAADLEMEKVRQERVAACMYHEPEDDEGSYFSCKHCCVRLRALMFEPMYDGRFSDEEKAVIRDFVIDLRGKR